MKAIIKKLSNKLLGKKDSPVKEEGTITPIASEEKVQEVTVLDGLGAIKLHENWRN